MICWLPLYTSNTIQAFCHQNCPTPSPAWLDFLIILSHINSAGSPFLYAFHMKDFRQALRRLICLGAINKRKLRDLRREELFSISGRRPASSGSVVNVFDPPGKLLANRYLYKGGHDWRQVNSLEKEKPRNSGVNSGHGSRQGPSHVRRVDTRQHCTVPKCSVKIEVEVEQQLKEQTLSCP